MINLFWLTFLLGFSPKYAWIMPDNWCFQNVTGFYFVIKNPNTPKMELDTFKMLKDNGIKYNYSHHTKTPRWGRTYFVTQRVLMGQMDFDWIVTFWRYC